MIKAVIIEDEERSRMVLKSLLKEHFSEIEVVAEADDVDLGIQKIKKHLPDIIFLDIQLKSGTGFDILKNINLEQSHIIFTTAYDKYALQAFKYSALDYLLKPIILQELIDSINKFKSAEGKFFRKHRIDVLLSNIKKTATESPILMVSSSSTYDFI